jgi:cell division protein FtsI (penicillin-binding protein 3)
MPGMDCFCGEFRGKVKAVGMGKVKTQSLQAGQDIIKNTTITLELL